MNITQLRAQRDFAAITHVLGFMKLFCWDKPQDFVPIKRDEKKKSPTRIAMEKAAQYICQCENGIGLNPKKLEMSMNQIKNWKFYFVKNMADKDNQQLVEACQKRIWNGTMNGKKLTCTHKNHKLGLDGAAKLADNILRMFYDEEVRAKEIPAIDPYFTREAGAVEWGQSMSAEEFLPRQFAEQPTGEYYLQSEDEHSVSWKMVDGEFGTDDKQVEDQEIVPVKTDWVDRNERYFDLRQDILHRKFPAGKIIKKAFFLAKTDMIGWGQFHKLRGFAADVAMFGGR